MGVKSYVKGSTAQADYALLRGLADHAPTLALILLPIQFLIYVAGYWGAWLDVEALRWMTELDQVAASAVGILLAAVALFVAAGVSRRERRYGHDGWWWGFGVFVLGPLGLVIWLAHYRGVHRAKPAATPAGVLGDALDSRTRSETRR